MSLSTLAIQTEAWVQEELGAQRALLDTLARTEQAARTGKNAELGQGAHALDGWLSAARARDARRRVLLSRLAGALGAAPGKVSLTRLADLMDAERLDTSRLRGLRGELRDVVAGVVRTSRRLGAVAQYHRGLWNDLCRELTAVAGGEPDSGALLDAEA